MLNPIDVASVSSSSSVTTRRTMLPRPSAPIMTSAWRTSPDLSLTVGRNGRELDPVIEVLAVVPFTESSSRAGSTDWTVTPNFTRAPADEARRCKISSRSAWCIMRNDEPISSIRPGCHADSPIGLPVFKSKIDDDDVTDAACASSFSSPQCCKILVALGGSRIPPGRFFRPRACSSTWTRWPEVASAYAAERPAIPPPTIIKSN